MANNKGNDPVGIFPTELHTGLTKRELFAAMALTGAAFKADPEVIAERALKIADALLEKLNGKTA